MRKFIFSLIIMYLTSCQQVILPKPKAFLNLEYDEAVYQNLLLNRPYFFEISQSAIIKDEPKYWLKIQYPKLNASIDITYRKIENNLRELLMESEKLVFKHKSLSEKSIRRLLDLSYKSYYLRLPWILKYLRYRFF